MVTETKNLLTSIKENLIPSKTLSTKTGIIELLGITPKLCKDCITRKIFKKAPRIQEKLEREL